VYEGKAMVYEWIVESGGMVREARENGRRGWKSCVRVANSCLKGAVVNFFSG
jgi:hypothetical protein